MKKRRMYDARYGLIEVPPVSKEYHVLKEIPYGKNKCICLSEDMLRSIENLVNSHISFHILWTDNQKTKETIKLRAKALLNSIEKFKDAYMHSPWPLKNLICEHFYNQFDKMGCGESPFGFHPGDIDKRLLKALTLVSKDIPNQLETILPYGSKKTLIRFIGNLYLFLQHGISKSRLEHKGNRHLLVSEKDFGGKYRNSFFANLLHRLLPIINKRLDEQIELAKDEATKKMLESHKIPDPENMDFEKIIGKAKVWANKWT